MYVKLIGAVALSLLILLFTHPCFADFGSQDENTAWLNDLMHISIGPNLLTNPGFETGDTRGWWNCVVVGSNRNSIAYSGLCCALASNRTANWAGPGQSLMGKMTDGKTYRISGWVRLENAESAPIDLVISQTEKWESVRGFTAYRDRWTKLSTYFTLKVKGILTELNFHITGPPAEVNFYFDDFEVAEVVELADWKTGADHWIEKIRKSDAQISILTPEGYPVEGVDLHIKQIKHRFGFGAAITYTEDRNYLDFFKEHFEWAVAGWESKWRCTEPQQGDVDYSRADKICDFCIKNGIKLRGHCLFWAAEGNQPDWVRELTYAPLPDESELLTALENRLNSAMNHFKGKYLHWDINNEMLRESFYADRLGDSIRTWMFQEANRIDPNCPLFTNEYAIICGNGSNLNSYKNLLTNLLNSGAPVHAIGVQGHIEEDLHRPSVIFYFNSIAEIGLPIWVTEFTVKVTDEITQANNVEDFYRIAFSHPAVDGVMMWDFYGSSDNDEWYIVDADWKLNEAGRRYESLMREWTTELDATTDKNGQIDFRGFHGIYEIMIIKDGVPRSVETVELLPCQGVAKFVLDDLIPLVEITSHNENDIVGEIVNLTVSATDDCGIRCVEFYVDDVLRFTDLSFPYSYHWNTWYLDNGMHSVVAQAIDTAGQQSLASMSLFVENRLGIGYIIYDDELRPGWSINSGVELDLQHSSVVHTGTYAISYICTETWHGIRFETDIPIHSDDYQSVEFYVRGFEGDEDLQVSIHCTDGNHYGQSLNAQHIQGGNITSSEWRLVTITLDELGVPSGQQIDYLGIANPSGTASVYIDDIQFTCRTISDEPPTVIIDCPVDGSTITGFERVMVSAEDDNGIERVEFYVDGKLRFTDDLGPTYQFDWDTSNDPNGQYKLSVLAYDTIGQNAMDEIIVNVDHAAEGLQPTFEDFETGDFSTFDWIHSGDEDWIIMSEQKNSGTFSAQAGPIKNNQSSTLSVMLDCGDGDISFYYKVSSESGFDKLQFYIDGIRQDEWSGEKDWTQVTFPAAAGTRLFEWTYVKDGSMSAGEDTAWIDDITFPIP